MTPPTSVAPAVVDAPGFVGRAAIAEAILFDLTYPAPGPALVVLTGPPGIGKTALALHVAEEARAQMPGGHSLIAMAEAEGRPRSPEDLLGELRACCPSGADGPHVVILDDVVSVEQVARLLPECGPATRLLVTSSMSLSGLVGPMVRRHRIGPLSPAESRQLLTTLLGCSRTQAESHAVDALAAACGHVPLALHLLGDRLRGDRRLRITDTVTWLRADPARRLAASADPSASLAHRLARHLGRLSPGLVADFGRLGRAAVDPLSPAGAAAVLGQPPAEAERVLHQLADANLLQDWGGRFAMNELIRVLSGGASAPVDPGLSL